jgi:hypothetical protein
MDPPQMGTSEIQEVSPELSKSSSFDHYLASSASEASLDHYLASSDSESDASFASLDHHLASSDSESDASFASAHDSLVSTDSESGSSPSAASGSARPTTSSLPTSKSFLSKVVSKVSKLKFWRRISGPDSIRDAVNATRRELQGPVNTGAYVSASSPESQTF